MEIGDDQLLTQYYDATSLYFLFPTESPLKSSKILLDLLHVSTYPVSGDVLPLRKFDFDMAGLEVGLAEWFVWRSI